MRGDRVVIWMDIGGGMTREFEVSATMNGRTVEVSEVKRGLIEVSELKKGGEKARTNKYMASRVIALVEERTEEPEAPAQLFEAS